MCRSEVSVNQHLPVIHTGYDIGQAERPQAVPGDEGDAIQRAAQVSNLAGGWQLPLLEWVD